MKYIVLSVGMWRPVILVAKEVNSTRFPNSEKLAMLLGEGCRQRRGSLASGRGARKRSCAREPHYASKNWWGTFFRRIRSA